MKVSDARPRKIQSDQEIAELRRQLAEAHEREAATGDVLRAIATSPRDLDTVLQTILTTAARLCDAHNGAVFRFDGQAFRPLATFNVSPEMRAHLESTPIHPGRESALRRVGLERRSVHIPDMLADPETATLPEAYRAEGMRTAVAVPLLKDDALVGAITIHRREARPFTERQIALLEAFADQAAIALENTRLFQDLSEALEQQTATSEVLKVISRSAFDLRAVLETLVENATRLCGARNGFIYRPEGDLYHMAVSYGASPEFRDFVERNPIRPGRRTLVGRAAVEGRTIHIPDVLADPKYRWGDAQRLGGFRTVLGVPMLRDGVVAGVVVLWRNEVQPFSDRQIELVQTFADQAAIAIENVRLFQELGGRNRDLSEALEQQTATSEVLKVISRSTFDLQPVLETLIENATRLCGAEKGFIFRLGGEAYRLLVAHGVTAQLKHYLDQSPIRAEHGGLLRKAGLEARAVHVPDALVDPEYRWQESQKLGGFRTILAVPMHREGIPIGLIVVCRDEVQPFTEKQIDLLETFADQAVIAIENVRLFQELEERNHDLSEALEQQTATGEVLRVIASSPTDLQSVLDTIAESAARLCGADDALIRRVDGDVLRAVAHYGSIPLAAENPQISRGLGAGRAVIERRTVHIHDIAAEPDEEFPVSLALARRNRTRTQLATPLLRQGIAIGAITVRRTEAQPFTDKQIRLLETFADQAVIAIENTRLFTELQDRNRDLTEALDQQTATSEILRVIASSPTDLQAVLDTISESATRLCEADNAVIFRFDGEVYRQAATYGLSTHVIEALERKPIRRLDRSTVAGRVGLERRTVQIPDVLADPEYQGPHELMGFRTLVGVPMLREGVPVGVIALQRTEVRPFTDQQIELLETFADQAVIAIENTRLFQEIQERNSDLSEALEQQTATSEILRIIASSPTDLQPVLDAVAENAAKLCEADAAFISRVEGDILRRVAASAGAPDVIGDTSPLQRGWVTARAVLDRAPVHIHNLQAVDRAEFPGARPRYERHRHRTALAVPLLREGLGIARGPAAAGGAGHRGDRRRP